MWTYLVSPGVIFPLPTHLLYFSLLPSFLFSFLQWLIKSYMVEFIWEVTGFWKVTTHQSLCDPCVKVFFKYQRKKQTIFNSQLPSNFNLTTSNSGVDKCTIKHAYLPNSGLEHQTWIGNLILSCPCYTDASSIKPTNTQFMSPKPHYTEVTNVRFSIVWGCIFVRWDSDFLGVEKNFKSSNNHLGCHMTWGAFKSLCIYPGKRTVCLTKIRKKEFFHFVECCNKRFLSFLSFVNSICSKC